jgi:cytochrome P450
MIAGGEALTYNMTHVLFNLLSNPECLAKLRAELDALGVGECEIWRDPRLGALPYLVCS